MSGGGNSGVGERRYVPVIGALNNKMGQDGKGGNGTNVGNMRGNEEHGQGPKSPRYRGERAHGTYDKPYENQNSNHHISHPHGVVSRSGSNSSNASDTNINSHGNIGRNSDLHFDRETSGVKLIDSNDNSDIEYESSSITRKENVKILEGRRGDNNGGGGSLTGSEKITSTKDKEVEIEVVSNKNKVNARKLYEKRLSREERSKIQRNQISFIGAYESDGESKSKDKDNIDRDRDRERDRERENEFNNNNLNSNNNSNQNYQMNNQINSNNMNNLNNNLGNQNNHQNREFFSNGNPFNHSGSGGGNNHLHPINHIYSNNNNNNNIGNNIGSNSILNNSTNINLSNINNLKELSHNNNQNNNNYNNNNSNIDNQNNNMNNLNNNNNNNLNNNNNNNYVPLSNILTSISGSNSNFNMNIDRGPHSRIGSRRNSHVEDPFPVSEASASEHSDNGEEENSKERGYSKSKKTHQVRSICTLVFLCVHI